MEHVDPLTGATPAWDAFIQSINPAAIERIRFKKPRPSERPGSAAWNRMVADHSEKRANFYRDQFAKRLPTITDDALKQMLHESAMWERRHEANLTERHLQIALAVTNPKGSEAA